MSHGHPSSPPGEGALSALAELARRESRGEAPAGADARGRARVLAAFRAQRGDGTPVAMGETPKPAARPFTMGETPKPAARPFAMGETPKPPARPFAMGETPKPPARPVTATRPNRRSGPWRALLPAVAAIVLACAVALVLALPGREPLAFTVGGAPAAAGAYVHGTAEKAGSTVRFGDGSEIVFVPGAGGRVAEIGPHGARVLLETGTASFTIAHRPGARWSVEAGPYAVAVIGTAFDATWSVETQTLGVRLHSGEVAVVGPLAPRGVHLHAGQELTATVGGELRIGQLAGEPARDVPPPSVVSVDRAGSSASTATVDPRPAEAPSPPAAPAPRTPAQPPTITMGETPKPPPQASASAGAALDWPRRVAAGDFRGVVTDAEARGVDAMLARAALPDLAALADAARYAGRSELARRALLAERTRFSGSPEARAAAFLLGRIADDGGGAPGAAVRWYDDYLREAPGGAFAAEALGRKLAALRRAGDPSARAAAADYLRRYPEGPHAAQAREIVGSP